MRKKIIIALFLCVMITNISAQALGLIPVSKKNNSILVIMYHKLSENPAEWSDFCISPQKFEEDVVYLKEQGFNFKTASEIEENGEKLKGRNVVITFDDGYESDYKYAFEIIKKHSVKATFFVAGCYVNTDDYLTEKMIKEMSESEFVEIGNHSYLLHEKGYKENQKLQNSHAYKVVVYDFLKNKEYLEKITGKEVTSLTFPNGVYSSIVNERLIKNGVKVTFSTGREEYDFDNKTPLGRRTREDRTTIKQVVLDSERTIKTVRKVFS